MLLKRTKVTLVLVLSFVLQNNCDNDAERPYDMDDISEHLLRNIDEKLEENVPRRETRTTIPDIERNFDTEQKIDKSPDLYTTIEPYTTTETEDDYKTDRDDKKETEDVNIAVTPIDATETVDYTLSNSNNDVYRRSDEREDIYSNNNNSNESVFKTETTTSQQATTRAMDDMGGLVPRISDLDDMDVPGPRKQKTETSIQRTPTPPVITKPRPSSAISKSSTLKGWLEDTWLRPPAGILVPLRPMALQRALAVWNDLTSMDRLNVTDIVIIGYDATGVNWRSRHNLQQPATGGGKRAVAEALSKLLMKYQGVHTDSTSDGTMKALASATKLVPYDSALFVVTDKGAGDPQKLPLALRALIEKRLKVYTIWTDPNHPSIESELALQELKNVSMYTEGDVLPYSLQVIDMETNTASEANQRQNEKLDPKNTSQARQARVNAQAQIDRFDTLLVIRGGGEAISVGVPVENGVSALRIYIEGAVEHAVLYPPNDAPQIDLYNVTSVRAFSPASRTDGLSPRDVYLVFPGAKFDVDLLSVLPANPTSSDVPGAMVGLWHLSVRCDTCDYRLFVTARAQIHFNTELAGKNMLKLRVTGPVASVRESLLIDEYGTELAKLPFSYQPIAGDGPEDTGDGTVTELVADVELPTVKGSKIYAKIVGRDIRGEPFSRLSGPINRPERMSRSASVVFPDVLDDLELLENINSRAYNTQNAQLQYNDSNILPNSRAISQVVNQRGALLTSVQIGLSSRLYGAPGDTILLHFEVTNYREQSVSFSFEAVGELRFLRGISPNRQVIQSGQTANVIVTVGITASAQPGARDLITFTANGLEQVSISAYVYVTNTGVNVVDTWAPELRHNFQGTCIGRMGDDCAQHVWSATVIARDGVGGLLRLSSSPIGLFYESNFIAGSRDEVFAVYRATCCAPRVLITAVDAYGNANSYTIDISTHENHQIKKKVVTFEYMEFDYFTQAGIAAIVLGVFLAILIIVLIAFLIYWCVRRRKESRELPSYSTRN